MKYKFIFLTCSIFLSFVNNVTAQVSLGNKVRELKLPDLQLTSIQVSEKKTENGGATYYREISYTIINNGTKTVCQADIGVQGYLTDTNPWDGVKLFAGCGWPVATRTSQGCPMLDPGQSVTNKFRCTDNSSFGTLKYYVLLVDEINTIPELNDENNQKMVLIQTRKTLGIANK